MMTFREKHWFKNYAFQWKILNQQYWRPIVNVAFKKSFSMKNTKEKTIHSYNELGIMPFYKKYKIKNNHFIT